MSSVLSIKFTFILDFEMQEKWQVIVWYGVDKNLKNTDIQIVIKNMSSAALRQIDDR